MYVCANNARQSRANGYLSEFVAVVLERDSTSVRCRSTHALTSKLATGRILSDYSYRTLRQPWVKPGRGGRSSRKLKVANVIEHEKGDIF